MEKLYNAEKSATFLGRHRRRGDIQRLKTPNLVPTGEWLDGGDSLWREHVEDADHHDVDKVSEDIDRSADTISTVDDKSNLPEVRDSVKTFSKIVEWRIAKYNSADSPAKFGKMTEEDMFFFEAVKGILKLNDAFGGLPAGSAASLWLNRVTLVLQRAILFLEQELRDLLEYPTHSVPKPKDFPRSTKQYSSFKSSLESPNRNGSPEIESAAADQEFPTFPPEVVTMINRITTAMISAGHETKCRRVFIITRRIAFNNALTALDYDPINLEEVQKMQWDSLEVEIAKWIAVVNHCVKVLFAGELKFYDAVFSENPSLAMSLFSDLARTVVMKLLNFAEAVVQTRRSSEKLFKYLDMYVALRNLVSVIRESCSEKCVGELGSEISAIGDRVGEAVVYIFCGLENSIKGDAARTPVPGGAIHPLTRHVMNYLEHAFQYKDTMEAIFQKNKDLVRSITNEQAEVQSLMEDQASSPLVGQLMTTMKLLDANLDTKAKLYRDPSLQCIFLMNNGRYIQQKIKGSPEILQLVDDTYYRGRSTVVRHYHRNYQRETCGRLLQCFNPKELQANGKVIKSALKERFKAFNNLCEEIHRTQSAWVVSDPQLQSELRVAMAAVVIPAYRCFLSRFRQYLKSEKHPEKYIKYQPEEMETLIEGLFDGNASSICRREHSFL